MLATQLPAIGVPVYLHIGIACAVLLSTSALARASEGAVASVDFIAPGGKTLSEVALIKRAGHSITEREIIDSGLKPGDLVQVRDRETVLLIRYLATRRLVVVRQNAYRPEEAYQVGAPPIPGLSGALFKTFAEALNRARNQVTSFVQGSEQDYEEYTAAATRSIATARPDTVCDNSSGKSNSPIRFRAPALNPYVNRLMAGNRALLVEWRGGVEPYSFIIRNSRGDIISQLKEIRNTCSATLPAATLPSGEVNLNIRDGNNSRISIQPIDVVTKLPPVPAGLAAAGLPTDAQTLYYATWLTTQDDGVWTFEAMQIVRALDCRSPGVLEWLSQYGSPPSCVDSRASIKPVKR